MKLLLVLAIAGVPYPQTIYAERLAANSDEEDHYEDSQSYPTSQADEGEYVDAEVDDSAYSDGDFINDGLNPEETFSDTPLSIQIQSGRKWYKDNNFALDTFEFITEWYLFQNFPIKIGPTLSYNKLTQLSGGVTGGQILELGVRSSFFWDFGSWTPYIALKYTMISSGSIDIKQQLSATSSRGTLDLDISGFNLITGIQINLAKQVYLIMEGSLINEEKIKQSGRLATATRDENSGEVTRDSDLLSSTSNKKSSSLSLGVLFEL